MAYDDMKTKELWKQNSKQLHGGMSTVQSGKELMGRTDTSKARCRQSNEECNRRRESMKKKR